MCGQSRNINKNYRIASLILVKGDIPNRILIEKLSKESDVFILNDGEPLGMKNEIKYGAKSKAEAINKWIKEYGDKYDFVGIFDYDSDVELPFYPKILKYFDSNKVAFVQAKIKSNKGFLHEEVENFFETRVPEPFLSCGHNVVYRTEVLKKIPLPESLGEDFLHTFKIWKEGYTSKLAKDVITYEDTPNLKKFLEREFKWSSIEPLYIINLKDVILSPIPIIKKIEIFIDIMKVPIMLMILVSILFANKITILLGMILDAIITRVRKLSLPLLIFLIIPFSISGFVYGIYKLIRNKNQIFIPTSKFSLPKPIFLINVIISIILYITLFVKILF